MASTKCPVIPPLNTPLFQDGGVWLSRTHFLFKSLHNSSIPLNAPSTVQISMSRVSACRQTTGKVSKAKWRKRKRDSNGSIRRRFIPAAVLSDLMPCDILSLICSLKTQTAVAYFVLAVVGVMSLLLPRSRRSA